MLLIDTFLCTCASDPLRKGLYEACYSRWMMEGGKIRLYILTPEIVGCTRKQFQGMRRPWIEAHAQSSIYIMAEDDCLLIGPDAVTQGLRILEAHPEFAVLSPLLYPFPPKPHAWEDEEVYEGISSGGINFTRKGILKDMVVPTDRVFDESTQAEWLRQHGWKTGWMKKVRQNHLGAFFSTIWPDDYASGTTKLNVA